MGYKGTSDNESSIYSLFFNTVGGNFNAHSSLKFLHLLPNRKSEGFSSHIFYRRAIPTELGYASTHEVSFPTESEKSKDRCAVSSCDFLLWPDLDQTL